MRAAKAVLMALAVYLANVSVSHAVIIRHDVQDKKYIHFGTRTEFQAGRVSILDARGNYTGVLIADRFVLTVGHPIVGFLKEGRNSGPVQIKIQHGMHECDVEFAYLHPRYDRDANSGGADLAVLRLKESGVVNVTPATIWIGNLAKGDRFIGIGQGRSGTGRDREEPKPAGTFRGYENTVDYIAGEELYSLFRSDFDDGTETFNTLARVVYASTNKEIAGTSSKIPLPLEGTTAAGDSGGGVWILRANRYHLAGIASFRFFSMYGGQPGYVNLSHPVNVEWLEAIAKDENVTFELHKRK